MADGGADAEAADAARIAEVEKALAAAQQAAARAEAGQHKTGVQLQAAISQKRALEGQVAALQSALNSAENRLKSAEDAGKHAGELEEELRGAQQAAEDLRSRLGSVEARNTELLDGSKALDTAASQALADKKEVRFLTWHVSTAFHTCQRAALAA